MIHEQKIYIGVELLELILCNKLEKRGRWNNMYSALKTENIILQHPNSTRQ